MTLPSGEGAGCLALSTPSPALQTSGRASSTNTSAPVSRRENVDSIVELRCMLPPPSRRAGSSARDAPSHRRGWRDNGSSVELDGSLAQVTAFVPFEQDEGVFVEPEDRVPGVVDVEAPEVPALQPQERAR